MNQPYVAIASGVIASFFFIIILVALRIMREFRIALLWFIVLLV